MIEDARTGLLRPFDFTHLLENVPKIKKLGYDINHVQPFEPIDSSDIDIPHWQEIARTIARNYDAYDGFVVLHGTDTMAYTASALSFMLENLHKPVIITGSQLPIGEVRTDGEENLITALQIAAATDSRGEAIVQEVAILFENYLWRGNRATKSSADNFNAFRSNNYPPLATIGLEIEYNTDALIHDRLRRPLNARYAMDPNVGCVTIFPGMSRQMLTHILEVPGLKAVVIRTYGAGNAPTGSWFLDSVREAADRGLVIVNVTQCVNGGVDAKRYQTGSALSKAGALSGGDITFEAAITKLMFLFGLGLSAEAVKKYVSTALCGEISI